MGPNQDCSILIRFIHISVNRYMLELQDKKPMM